MRVFSSKKTKYTCKSGNNHFITSKMGLNLAAMIFFLVNFESRVVSYKSPESKKTNKITKNETNAINFKQFDILRRLKVKLEDMELDKKSASQQKHLPNQPNNQLFSNTKKTYIDLSTEKNAKEPKDKARDGTWLLGTMSKITELFSKKFLILHKSKNDENLTNKQQTAEILSSITKTEIDEPINENSEVKGAADSVQETEKDLAHRLSESSETPKSKSSSKFFNRESQNHEITPVYPHSCTYSQNTASKYSNCNKRNNPKHFAYSNDKISSLNAALRKNIESLSNNQFYVNSYLNPTATEIQTAERDVLVNQSEDDFNHDDSKITDTLLSNTNPNTIIHNIVETSKVEQTEDTLKEEEKNSIKKEKIIKVECGLSIKFFQN
ncbi:hypothetical protein EDEG_02414 [Edhazardia aedis USNM 41457]|uniref:Uncharacterized protein n=1 Tax=Edhazardia aedis (strain USNM 41457) TaxID=1003232 RepID=J9DKU6_EDHAE|nr:hypothetical protein EDEG_02414 [Edhazardia aedis USNM 41457]|eukprot:EJW03215.1 hypothetical protein EDEG_02414 [Edhazardia aedis USNM 41457]